MKPVQFNSYIRRETGGEFRFIGYAQVIGSIGDAQDVQDVCLLAPVCSGFQMAAAEFKRTPEHTLYFICAPEDFAEHFDESSPAVDCATEGVK